MKKVPFEGVSENAYGKPIAPLKYATSFDKLESPEEMREKNAYPTDAVILKLVNAQRKANARQKAMQAAWDAAGLIKPTLENDEQLRLKGMFKILIAAGKDEAEARTIASATLGIEWADGDDDEA